MAGTQPFPEDGNQWSRQEAEEAFKAFGNLYLKTVVLQAKYGSVLTADAETLAKGAQEMQEFLDNLSDEELQRVHDFCIFMMIGAPMIHDLVCYRLKNRGCHEESGPRKTTAKHRHR
jgi:hypothetical protein